MKIEVKHGLPPIAPNDARLFILGSLPGDASIAASRYYAHPRNMFWRLVGTILGDDLQSVGYDERLDRLRRNRIGLWDVVAYAQRRGSLDQAIRSAGHNPLVDFLSGFPSLEAVAFNGATAARIGRKLLDGLDAELIDLPSSSPANTLPFKEKARAWARLSPYCGRPLP